MKKSLLELKGLIKSNIAYEKSFLQNPNIIDQNKNPQVKKMIDNSEVRKDILEDILYYIETGSKCQLKIRI